MNISVGSDEDKCVNGERHKVFPIFILNPHFDTHGKFM